VSALSRCYNIEDLHRTARRRLPRGVYEFVERGTEDDVAVRENLDALRRIKLQPSMLVDCSHRSQAADLIGQQHPMPLAVAPMGAAGLMWHQGELAAAQAAAAVGVPYALATAAMTPMETIADRAGGRLWFQLYVRSDRELTHSMIERAKHAGFEGLIVTVDMPVLPNREFNERNGFGLPYRRTVRSVMDVMRKPSWALRVLGRYLAEGGMPRYENYPEPYRQRITSDASSRTAMRTDSLTWGDLRDLRDRWNGSFLVKGILRPEDAVRACEAGADGIIVSNHGGRNLDCVVPAIEVLGDVVRAVRGRAPVLFDSGVRRGSDIVKAIALGAQGVLVGRPVLWGAAVAGAAGAEHALRLLQRELDLTQALLGCPRIADINRSLIHRPGGDAEALLAGDAQQPGAAGTMAPAAE
jgi:isopentenyl diphosphate isomerase/L-lactate dehydrogenase-like FMN-dependent dehydrogenase